MKADLLSSSWEIETVESKEDDGTEGQRSETRSASRWTRSVAVAALVLGTGALGCAPQGPADADLTPQEEEALADTLTTVNEEFLASWSELEPDAYLERVGEDVRLYFQRWYEGEAFRTAVRDIMAAYRSYPVEITDADVEVLGPDAGVVTGTYRAQPVDTAGESQTLNAAFTFVYERRGGDWLLVRGHESLVPEEEGEAGS